MGQKLRGWLQDYAYVAYWTLRSVVARSTPEDLLQPATGPYAPVLLIPGVYENWRFLQPLAEHVYRAGHPVHVLDKLGYNTGAIPEMALLVSDYLERHDLRDVTLIAHSKGGLIGMHALGNPQTFARVRHLVALNTPFSGSRYAALFLLPSVRMFAPRGPVIRQLARDAAVHAKITSLYSVFDPHIPETGRLAGAENIVLPAIGHFRPIADAETLRLLSAILRRPPGQRPRIG